MQTLKQHKLMPTLLPSLLHFAQDESKQVKQSQRKSKPNSPWLSLGQGDADAVTALNLRCC